MESVEPMFVRAGAHKEPCVTYLHLYPILQCRGFLATPYTDGYPTAMAGSQSSGRSRTTSEVGSGRETRRGGGQWVLRPHKALGIW